jgi:hypothetical protein
MKSKARSATKSQLRRMLIIKSITGCVACIKDDRDPVPCNAHHMLAGGQRIGHDHTYGLCTFHHVGELSIHGSKRRFLEKYGSEQELLEMTNKLIAEFESSVTGGTK